MSETVKRLMPRATGKAVNDRVAKIGLYRECLQLAQLAETSIKSKSMKLEVQETWRKQRGHGEMLLECALALCLDRIAYGRMCLCKQRLRTVRAASETYDWAVKNPMDNYAKLHRKRHESESQKNTPEHFGGGNRDFVPATNWGFGNVDPEMKVMQKKALDHHFFMGPHWRNKPKPINMDDLSFEEGAIMYGRGKPNIPKTPTKHY
jgi:hypothetical protein